MDENNVKIADEVVAVVSGVAAMEVEGVAGMSSTLVGGIAELLGKKNLSKGVKITMGEGYTEIEVFIIVDYGCKMPDVGAAVQQRVKETVESMTGLNVIAVNVNIEGIKLPM